LNFLYINIKNNFFKIKNIILIYFQLKNILKFNYYNNSKHAIKKLLSAPAKITNNIPRLI